MIKYHGALLTGLAMIAHAQQPGIASVDRILSSGSPDLWVRAQHELGSKRMVVQLWSIKVPIEDWAFEHEGNEPKQLLYSEIMSGPEWESGPAVALYAGAFHLSKYDDHSAFALDWGYFEVNGAVDNRSGTILRHEGGHLIQIPEAMKQARKDYELKESDNFLGIVGTRVLYYDKSQPGRLFFYDKSRPDQRYEVIVNTYPAWLKKSRLEEIDQAFSGDNPDEVLVAAWGRVLKRFWIRNRRFPGSLRVNLRNARPIAPIAK